MNQTQSLIVETVQGGVGLVRIHRPERRNALNQSTLRELAAAVSSFDHDPDIGCVVITGDSEAFAAGADVNELEGRSVADIVTGARAEAWETLRAVRIPLIAAVSGYALGGGLELAMLCDMIVVSETAKLGQPELKLGIMPGAGGTQRLTKQLGKYLAMEVVLAGRLLNAEEAVRFGLANRVATVAEYLEHAVALARVVASQAPVARLAAKDAVQRAQDLPLELGLAYERRAFSSLFGTEDQTEGVRAFLEKRAPIWSGR